jgi:ribonuclease D
LRLLRKASQFTPSAIFDTMLAARLLGERQFGLSSLVEKFLGVKLDKGSQKADWAQRPLTEKMEIYARNDTHYLKPLADKLKSCARSERPPRVASGILRAIDCRMFAGARRGRGFRLAHQGQFHLEPPRPRRSARTLAWREREAIAANRPPFFILNHEKMVDIAEPPPRTSSGGKSFAAQNVTASPRHLA